MKWITRERPKIDRIACPWLIARFIDKAPEFLFVPSDRVMAEAGITGAIPFDVPNVELSHVGDECSFDTFFFCIFLSDINIILRNNCETVSAVVVCVREIIIYSN